MNKYIVSPLSLAQVKAQDVPSLLDEAGIGFESIDNVNWAETFPYKPSVAFRMAYAGDNILLNFQVTEDSVRWLLQTMDACGKTPVASSLLVR